MTDIHITKNNGVLSIEGLHKNAQGQTEVWDDLNQAPSAEELKILKEDGKLDVSNLLKDGRWKDEQAMKVAGQAVMKAAGEDGKWKHCSKDANGIQEGQSGIFDYLTPQGDLFKNAQKGNQDSLSEAIATIGKHDDGKEILKSIVTYEKDGGATVHYGGKTYTVSREALQKEANEKGGSEKGQDYLALRHVIRENFPQDIDQPDRIQQALINKGHISRSEIIYDVKQNHPGLGKGTGDCWLLASLQALNTSEGGKKKIQDSVKWIDNGTANPDDDSAQVLYNGKWIEVSAEDINNPNNAAGDKLVKAIESAVRKNRHEAQPDLRDRSEKMKNSDKEGHDVLGGGSVGEFTSRFGSQKPIPEGEVPNLDISVETLNKDTLKQTLETAMNHPNGLNVTLSGSVTYGDALGDGSDHVFTITKVDMANEKIEYTNPFDTSKRYTISFEDLLKNKKCHIADLNKM